MKVAHPTIADVFAQFLAKTDTPTPRRPFTDRRGIVELLEHYLDGYAYESLSAEEEQFWRGRWEEDETANSFCRTFGAQKVPGHIDMFLGWFMIRKVAAGPETDEAAGPVTAELLAWLVHEGHLRQEDAATVAERAREASSDLPRAGELGSLLYDVARRKVTGPVVEDLDVEDDVVTISRVEQGKLWFEHPDGLQIGPLAVPPAASKLAVVGWELSAAHFVKTRRGWHLVELGNVYPR